MNNDKSGFKQDFETLKKEKKLIHLLFLALTIITIIIGFLIELHILEIFWILLLLTLIFTGFFLLVILLMYISKK